MLIFGIRKIYVDFLDPKLGYKHFVCTKTVSSATNYDQM